MLDNFESFLMTRLSRGFDVYVGTANNLDTQLFSDTGHNLGENDQGLRMDCKWIEENQAALSQIENATAQMVQAEMNILKSTFISDAYLWIAGKCSSAEVSNNIKKKVLNFGTTRTRVKKLADGGKCFVDDIKELADGGKCCFDGINDHDGEEDAVWVYAYVITDETTKNGEDYPKSI